jgi:beta-lactamase regulating signal transducer with metallopeptidase domain
VTALLIENMVHASVTLLLVLLLRRPVAELFGAGWAYALWLLPALGLVIPPLPFLGAELDLLPPLATVISLSGDPAASLPPEGGSGQWTPILLAAWAGGAAAFLAWQWLVYRRFLTGLSFSGRSAGAHGGLPLIESESVDGPLAVGLLDRRIVVPADFRSRYSPEEQRLALDHEAVHHRRGDIWSNLAAILFLAVNWFNPLAWLSFRAFRMDQELACDAAVAGAASAEERQDYARSLVKSASRPGLIAACPLNHADQLKRRLKMMKNHKVSRLRSAGGLAALGLALCATAGLGTAAAQEKSGDGKQRERIVIMEMKDGAAPPSGAARSFTIRRGDNGEIIAPEGCSAGSELLANVNEGNTSDRTRILLCGRSGEMSAEQRLEALQRARARIAEATAERDAEHRSRVLEALDREIARARAR